MRSPHHAGHVELEPHAGPRAQERAAPASLSRFEARLSASRQPSPKQFGRRRTEERRMRSELVVPTLPQLELAEHSSFAKRQEPATKPFVLERAVDALDHSKRAAPTNKTASKEGSRKATR